MKRTLIFGLIAGVVTIIPTAIILFSGSTILFEKSWLAMAMGLLIPMAFMIVGGLRERRVLGGFMAYGHALKTTYVIYAISTILGILFATLFHNGVDPGYMERNKEVIMKSGEDGQRWAMELAGASEADILNALDETLEAREKQFNDQVDLVKKPKGILLQLFLSLVFGILLALIAALFVRRNPKPETA